MSGTTLSRWSLPPLRDAVRVPAYVLLGFAVKMLSLDRIHTVGDIVNLFIEPIIEFPLAVILTPDLASIALWSPVAVALFWHYRRTRTLSREVQFISIVGIVAGECLFWFYMFGSPPNALVRDATALGVLLIFGFVAPALAACWALDTVVRGINQIGVFLNARN